MSKDTKSEVESSRVRPTLETIQNRHPHQCHHHRAQLNLYLDETGSSISTWFAVPGRHLEGSAGRPAHRLVQLLADMKPGFLRFPGGCIVEGSDLAKRYQWKTHDRRSTNRKLIINRWNDEFNHRPDAGLLPVVRPRLLRIFPAVRRHRRRSRCRSSTAAWPASSTPARLAPLDRSTTIHPGRARPDRIRQRPGEQPWGASAPRWATPSRFNLKMMGVGNEQWGPQYIERYKLFAKAIKAKHPEIKLVSAPGRRPAASRSSSCGPNWRELNADIVDEHYYVNPEWFLANADRYDKYDRERPEGFRRRIRRPKRRRRQRRQPQQLECRALPRPLS